MKKVFSIIVVLLMSVSLIGCSGQESDDQVSGTPTNDNVTNEVNKGQFVTELISGHYTAGKDFPSGKYDIVAVRGDGNVSSSNAYSGGLNESMGVSDNDQYTMQYKNANLTSGVVLSVSGVTIKITSSEDVNLNEVTTRNLDESNKLTLGSGNYTAGVDFEPGVYNITAVSGDGNVHSSNILGNGLNAIMGISGGMYEKEYLNVELDNEVILQISGGIKIDLIPQK